MYFGDPEIIQGYGRPKDSAMDYGDNTLVFDDCPPEIVDGRGGLNTKIVLPVGSGACGVPGWVWLLGGYALARILR